MSVTWPAVPPVRLMGDLGLCGVRRAKSLRTTRSAPREQCSADLVRRHFEAFALNELCGVLTFSRKREVPPPMYAPSPGGSTAPSSRRVLAEDHRLADLHQSVHRPGPRRPGDRRLATKTSGADLTGLVHHFDRGA